MHAVAEVAAAAAVATLATASVGRNNVAMISAIKNKFIIIFIFAIEPNEKKQRANEKGKQIRMLNDFYLRTAFGRTQICWLVFLRA